MDRKARGHDSPRSAKPGRKDSYVILKPTDVLLRMAVAAVRLVQKLNVYVREYLEVGPLRASPQASPQASPKSLRLDWRYRET